jgi:hypothetical protein
VDVADVGRASVDVCGTVDVVTVAGARGAGVVDIADVADVDRASVRASVRASGDAQPTISKPTIPINSHLIARIMSLLTAP